MFDKPDQLLDAVQNKKVAHGRLNLPDSFYPSWDQFIPFFDRISQEGHIRSNDWRKIWYNFNSNDFPIISEVYKQFGSLIGRPITSCHCYAGFSPAARASPPHVDSMEVLFVMIRGSMPWKIFENGCDYSDVTKSMTTRSTFSQRLVPGDYVYIPKGVWHCAVPDSSRVGFSFGWN